MSGQKTLKALELYIYKNNLQQKTILEMIGSFSPKTNMSILTDLERQVDLIISDNDIYIFSDGNCKKNGKKDAIAGFSVFFQNDNFKDFDKTEIIDAEEKTNNIAELCGIKYIIETIDENKERFKDYNIIICTDSMYSINCLIKWNKNWIKNNWKNAKNEPVKNKELIKQILEKLPKNVSFKHVFSHQPEPSDKTSFEWILWNGNNICDTNINKAFT